MSKTAAARIVYGIMNEMDDRRERIVLASSTGRHEPVYVYDGLYSVEDVDHGGRFIERRERGIRSAFVPVAEISDTASLADLRLAPADKPVDPQTTAPPATRRPSVFIRRHGMTLPAI